MITVVVMYRGHDAETLVAVVEGRLSEEQKRAWRDAHGCDLDDDDDNDDASNMFFRELEGPTPNDQIVDLLNADGDTYPVSVLEREPKTIKDQLMLNQGVNRPG